MIRAANIPIPPDTDDPLALAISMFGCKACSRKDLRYPTVLAHLCNRRFDMPADNYETAVTRFWSPMYLHSSWRSKRLYASADAAFRVRPMLQACGFDPDRVTYRDVQRSKAVLICTLNPSRSRSSKINADGIFTLVASYSTYNAFIDIWRAVSARIPPRDMFPRS